MEPAVIEQKAEYIHNNPVEAGFVTEGFHHYKCLSPTVRRVSAALYGFIHK